MPPVDVVGKTGHALTEVGSDGRVDIDGVTYEAFTVRPPIPPGEPVVVTGWRLVGEADCVLSVRRPGDDGPATGAPPNPRPSATSSASPSLPASRATDELSKLINRLEGKLSVLQERHAQTREWLNGVLGALCGVVMSCCVPFAHLTETINGTERVSVRPLGGPVLYETSGPVGTKHDVKLMCAMAKLVACGGVGFGIGVAVSRWSDGRKGA